MGWYEINLAGNRSVTGNYPRKRMRGSDGLTTINFPVAGKFPAGFVRSADSAQQQEGYRWSAEGSQISIESVG